MQTKRSIIEARSYKLSNYKNTESMVLYLCRKHCNLKVKLKARGDKSEGGSVVIELDGEGGGALYQSSGLSRHFGCEPVRGLV